MSAASEHAAPADAGFDRGGRWLWISGELGADLTTGLLVYSSNLARSVATTGADVTMVGLADTSRSVRSEPRVEPVGEGFLRTMPIRSAMRGGAASLGSRLPNLTFATATTEMRDAVTTLLGQSWDVVVIDHLQAAWALDLIAEGHDGATVFVTHNHEASMRIDTARRATGNPARRALLAFDARKAARLELAALQAADVVTAITDSDAHKFAADVPGLDCLVLPPGWNGQRPDHSSSGDRGAVATPIAQRPRRVGMLGSFEWHVKQENLRRFVTVADPVFADHGIELVVGGAVAPELRTELEPTLRATRLVGWVDDLDVFFDEIRVGVVSEPLGGGFKLKTLDYIFRSVPLAALSSSRSGIPVIAGESVLEASDERALVDEIVTNLDDADRLETLAAAALTACADAFEWSDRGAQLAERCGFGAGIAR